MNTPHGPLQKGSVPRLATGVIAVAVFVVAAALESERRYLSLLWVLTGLYLTWREYQEWCHIHEQRGMELLHPDSRRP